MMEKLRSKSGQYKSYAESAKSLKIALLDKRNPMEMLERQQLQKCLDTLQHSFKVTSLQSMVERLGTVTRQFGYVEEKIYTSGSFNVKCFAKG